MKKRRLRSAKQAVVSTQRHIITSTQVLIIACMVVGAAIIAWSRASSIAFNTEPEASTTSGCISIIDDAAASGGRGVRFGSTNGCTSLAGAQLPIDYNLAAVAGTKRFIDDDNGSDTNGDGSEDKPYATIGKAYSVSAAGDTIIVRHGDYSEGNIVISQNKHIRIMAYPGEIPQFSGSRKITTGWTTEGSLSYQSYTPQPVTDGSGISFTTGQALTGDGVGKYPDQAWIGSRQLQQVTQKSSVTAGKFWVDATNNRLYLTNSDAAQGNIEVSNKDVFATIHAPNTTIEGLRITRYSNSANDYGVIKFMATADNGLLKHVELSDSAFIGIAYLGDNHIHTNSSMQNVTLTNSNWMGVSILYTESFTMQSVKISGMNQFNEFTHGLQSGALKTSRTRNTKVINSEIVNNNSPGLWFDQSNLHVEVAGNRIVDNSSSGVFFEISDDLYLINNYIKAAGDARAVKLAGSSGLKLINNTLVGGTDVVGVYVDERSQPGCSDPARPLCGNSYESDRDTVRPLPPTMSWIPAIDAMINNIVAYPTGAGYCGTVTTVCITSVNAGTTVALNKVIHPADPSLGIPQTIIDGNVYANGSGVIVTNIQGQYSTPANLSAALAGAPVNIPGLDINNKSGNSWVAADGTPTATLTSAHSQAVPIPSDPVINKYLSLGYKHYGVSHK